MVSNERKNGCFPAQCGSDLKNKVESGVTAKIVDHLGIDHDVRMQFPAFTDLSNLES